MVTMSTRCRRSPQKVGFYDIQKTIGRGNFAVVKLARHRITKTEVAIKIIDKTSLDQVNLKKIYREIQILKLLNHQHIIKLYQVIQTSTTIYLVCEYARNGELFEYITQKGKLPEENAQRMFWQVLCAVEYCHKNNVVHRDLKAENMLLDGNNNIKLADFGFGNFFQSGQNLSTWCGSPPYAAPEVFDGKVYEGPQLDVWSLGVVLYVLVCGTFPFDGSNLSALKERVLGGIFRIPYWMSQECENLLRRMLVLNPKKRLTISQIKKHKWLDSVRPKTSPYSNFNDGSSHFRRGKPSEYNEHVFKIMQNLGLDISKTKESLNLSEYDHLYAIYHLLADRLKLHRTSYPLESQVCEKRRPSNIAEQVLLSVPKFVGNSQNRSSNPLMVGFNRTTLSENVKSITNTMEVDDVCFDDVATGLPIVNRTLVDSPPLPLIKTTLCHDDVDNQSFQQNTNFNLLHIPNTGVPVLQQKPTNTAYGYNITNAGNLSSNDEMSDAGYNLTRSNLQQRRHTLMVPDANHIAQFNLGLMSQIKATNLNSSGDNVNHLLPELNNTSTVDSAFEANKIQMFNMQHQTQMHVTEHTDGTERNEVYQAKPRNLNYSPIGFREGRRASDGLLLLGDNLLKERFQKLARVQGVPELTKDIDTSQRQSPISSNQATLNHANAHGSNNETFNFQPYNNSQSLSRRRSLQVQHTQMRRSSVTSAPMHALYSNETTTHSNTYACPENFSGSHPHVSESTTSPEVEYLRHWSSWKQVQQGSENQNENNFGSNEDTSSMFSSIGMSVASDDSVPSKAAVAAQIQRDALQKPIRQQSLPISSSAKGNYPFSSAFSNHPQSLVQQLQQRRFERKIKVASHQQALAYQSPLPELEHLRIGGDKPLRIPPHSLSTGGLINVAHMGDVDLPDAGFTQENSVHGIRCFDEQTNLTFGTMNTPITLNEYIVGSNLEFQKRDSSSPDHPPFVNFGNNNNAVLSWVQDNQNITKKMDPMNIAMF